MMTADYFRLLARYSQWANTLVLDAVRMLDEAAYRQDRGAFFGSIHGTLNHIIVADRIWLQRFTGEGEAPARLDQEVCADFDAVVAARASEDARYLAFTDGLDDARVAELFSWHNMAGEPLSAPFAGVLAHAFNHQTHHRGHVHTMLSQAGLNPPQLDLIYCPDLYTQTGGRRS